MYVMTAWPNHIIVLKVSTYMYYVIQLRKVVTLI